MSAGLVNEGRDAVSQAGKTAVDAGQLLDSDFFLSCSQIWWDFELLWSCEVDDPQLNKIINTEETMTSSP